MGSRTHPYIMPTVYEAQVKKKFLTNVTSLTQIPFVKYGFDGCKKVVVMPLRNKGSCSQN